MIEDGAFACEIEVRVISKIDDGGFVSCRAVFDLQFVVVCQRVDDGDREISRKPLFTVLANIAEREADAILAFNFLLLYTLDYSHLVITT